MPSSARITVYLFFLTIVATSVFVSFKKHTSEQAAPPISLPQTVTPTPTPIDIYSPPIIATASSYTIIFVGDSMTEALGDNFDQLRKFLSPLYPGKEFGIFNYGYGSTSILSLERRLTQSTEYQGKTNQAILDRYFDVLIIESMGNNPLSEYPLDQGLSIQTQTLERLVALTAFSRPHSIIIFLSTIAPYQSLFGLGAVDLSPNQRNQWANERRSYIENHINFAKRHHFPLINVYEKSLDAQGKAVTKYFDSSNYIHPSKLGVELISREIADYLYHNQILPN